MVGQFGWDSCTITCSFKKPIWAQQLSFESHRPTLVRLLGKSPPPSYVLTPIQALWYAPSPFKSYHQGLGYADAVLPEVYLRHEGQYKDTDWYLADHRKGGFADRTFIALAMDSRQGKDEDGRKCPRWSSDRAETERQIRSLRTARPEMMGVALYGNFAEEDLIAEADDLFYRYWIMPVLTLELARHSGAVTLRNIGAMDARDVVVVGKGGSRDWVKKLLVVEAGESLNLDLSVGDGVRTVRIEPAPALTLLRGVIDVKG